MIVDDDPASAQLTSRLFSKIGVASEICVEPRRAATMIVESKPALVALDINMPFLSGFDVLALIRSHEQSLRLAQVPVMTITGRAGALDRARSLASGFLCHVTKPVWLDGLAKALRRVERLRETLQISRYSKDLPAIEAATAGIRTSSNPLALAAVASALLCEAEDAFIKALCPASRRDREMLDSSLDRLRRVAAGLGARQLAELFRRVALETADPATEQSEEVVVLARAECDRVAAAVRERALCAAPA